MFPNFALTLGELKGLTKMFSDRRYTFHVSLGRPTSCRGPRSDWHDICKLNLDTRNEVELRAAAENLSA